MDITEGVIRVYQDEVQAIYEEIRQQVRFTGAGSQERHKVFQRLAALISAATKRAKRTLVLEYLFQAKGSGLDITITVARHSVGRVLGRNVSRSEVIQKFGSPGRTASDKSEVGADDLACVEKEIVERLNVLQAAMRHVREALRHEYQDKW